MRLRKCTQGLSSYHPTERAKIKGGVMRDHGNEVVHSPRMTALYFLVFLFDRWTRGVNRETGRQHKTEAWIGYLCGVGIVAGTSHCPVLCLCCCCCCLLIFCFCNRENTFTQISSYFPWVEPASRVVYTGQWLSFETSRLRGYVRHIESRKLGCYWKCLYWIRKRSLLLEYRRLLDMYRVLEEGKCPI